MTIEAAGGSAEPEDDPGSAPSGGRSEWDDPGWEQPVYWDGPRDMEPPEGYLPRVPDALDDVVEAAGLVSILTAQQYQRVHWYRRDAVADARRDGVPITEIIERSIRLELASALGITESAAGALIAEAEALITRYPVVLDSLGAARMTPRHASILVDALDTLEPEFRERILQRALPLAESQPVGTFRRKLHALIDTVRAVTLTQRHEAATTRRRVVLEPAPDAMAWLHLYAPAVEARAVFDRATRIAKTITAVEEETRTLDQVRADVLGDLLLDGDTTTLPPQARGIRPTVVVTVPALTLLDQKQQGVAIMEGLGPIPLETARRLCGGGPEWMRVLTHPETGMVLSVGRDRYAPPESLRRLVKWRADTCMAPGCGIPASRCQTDHTVAWEHGGTTGLTNLAPLCQGHHTVKHHGRWCVEQIPDSGGALRWTSPSGRRYRVDPEHRVPSFTLVDDGSPPPF